MYAIIESGSKQLRVSTGSVIQIEKLEGEVGTQLTLDKVLFCSNLPSAEGDKKAEVLLGRPYLDGAKIETEIVGQGRGDKILTVKKKRRTGYKLTKGHRQYYTDLLITKVENGKGQSAELDKQEKEKILKKFFTSLAPKGDKVSRKPKKAKDKTKTITK